MELENGEAMGKLDEIIAKREEIHAEHIVKRLYGSDIVGESQFVVHIFHGSLYTLNIVEIKLLYIMVVIRHLSHFSSLQATNLIRNIEILKKNVYFCAIIQQNKEFKWQKKSNSESM